MDALASTLTIITNTATAGLNGISRGIAPEAPTGKQIKSNKIKLLWTSSVTSSQHIVVDSTIRAPALEQLPALGP